MRWRTVVLGAAGVVTVVALALWRVVDVTAREFRVSRPSASAEEAAARGVLVARPAVAPETVRVAGSPLRAREAWIEEETRVDYRWYLVRRDVRTGRTRLVLRLEALPREDSRLTAVSGAERLEYAPGRRFDESVGIETWIAEVVPPFPDTLRLRPIR